MSAFSHELFARQVPSVTVVWSAVQKLLSFWMVPSLVALSPCLCANPTGRARGLPGSHEARALGGGACFMSTRSMHALDARGGAVLEDEPAVERRGGRGPTVGLSYIL